MSEHKGLPVPGYTLQSEERTAQVIENKHTEERILRLIESLELNAGVDQRCLAIARTEFQQAFMWLNRAIFRPSRIELPEDDTTDS